MLTIELKDLKFYGYHGVHKDESKIGGEYIVDVSVYFEPRNFPVRYIDETYDYTNIYTIIKRRMEIPTELIETLTTEITQEILTTYNMAQEVTVKVRKINVPIPSFEGTVSAKYEWKRGGRR